MTREALRTVLDRLNQASRSSRRKSYHIPVVWEQHGIALLTQRSNLSRSTSTDSEKRSRRAASRNDSSGAVSHSQTEGTVIVNPISYFSGIIQSILREPLSSELEAGSGEWTRRAVVYNMFVRHTTAWDHDADGRVRIEELHSGFRETGTFLKSIAMLPLLRQMGVNTIHLLPVTAVGRDGNKGSLGSPYAIRNPFLLDPLLAEPVLKLDVETEYAAFVEAAHQMGMRVVMEFVFRTAARDSDWIEQHPDWFYWIDAEMPDRSTTSEGFGNPHFSRDELEVIHQRVESGDLWHLPAPESSYQHCFTDVPQKVERIGNRYIGTTASGKRCRIPPAFADWPPDDVQPPWDDVTYLRLYAHEAFNYIAYNTVRHYDNALAVPENEIRDLWQTIIGIIPHYIERFDIDGVMIDMGHALPGSLKQAIVEKARERKSDFAFWEENFAIGQASRNEGYNATVGYLWSDEHIPEKLRRFVSRFSMEDVPVPFFATPETHNTPRASSRDGGVAFSRMAFGVNSFLPGVLYVHQGFELGETTPVNTGLGFTKEEAMRFPSHKLPLFSEGHLCWDARDNLIEYISKVCALRKQWEDVIVNPSHGTLHLIPSPDERVLAFARTAVDHSKAVIIIANMDCKDSVQTMIPLPVHITPIEDAITGTTFSRSQNGVHLRLDPGQVIVIH